MKEVQRNFLKGCAEKELLSLNANDNLKFQEKKWKKIELVIKNTDHIDRALLRAKTVVTSKLSV